MKFFPALLATLLIGAPAWANDTSALFDAPSHIRHLQLPGDPESSDDAAVRKEIGCFYYDHVMIKQIDIGEEGASQLSIVPAGSGEPPCRMAPVPHEFVIPAENWSGYFKGLKSNYAFFDAEDGTNGGLGMAIYDVPKKRMVFQDVVVGDIHSIEAGAGGLKLRYQRAYAADCSVATQGKKCWDKIAHDTGLNEASMPDCAAAYLKAKSDMARAQCQSEGEANDACLQEKIQTLNAQQWDDDPTVIGYFVEVTLSGTAVVARPLNSEAACWPAD